MNSEPTKVLMVGDGPSPLEVLAAFEKTHNKLMDAIYDATPPAGMTVTTRRERGKMLKCPYCRTRRGANEKCCSASYAVVNMELPAPVDSKGKRIEGAKPHYQPMKLKQDSGKP